MQVGRGLIFVLSLLALQAKEKFIIIQFGLMVSLILLIFAAIFKAVADEVDHHFDTSIFRRHDPNFWDRDISSDKAKRICGYKIDAWHISLSCMIVCMILAAIFHQPKLAWYWELLIGGFVWNTMFNIFYNKILR